MKKLLLFIFLAYSGFSYGQVRAVSNKIKDLNAAGLDYVNFDVFAKDNNADLSKYKTSATDVTVIDLNSSALDSLLAQAPKYISLTVPYQNELLHLQLYRHHILTPSFFVLDAEGNEVAYNPGEYYRGIVRGDYQSIVAVSFFQGNVMGVISTYAHGNIVLGKSKDKRDFITYSDMNLLGENPFVCGVESIDYNQQEVNNISYSPDPSGLVSTDKCARIYYEIGHELYLLNNSSVQNTVDWITGIQNNIGTIYSNDDLHIALNTVKVWTTDDPYDGTYGENLQNFSYNVTDFDGDLAHLIKYPSTTSVAYLNSMCTTAHYAYSGIDLYYQQVPTYSWTINVMSHEMGHAFGSPHTHACAWNGNNTAIDGCGPAAGYDEGCDGPIPYADGGTIMSYCHLLPNVGVNFANGFGSQPSDLIRTTMNSKSCLGFDCEPSVSDCGQGVGSNGFEYLASIGADSGFGSADDFEVSPGNTMNIRTIKMNVFAYSPLASISFEFLNDDSGTPGSTIITTANNLVPYSQEQVGTAFGFNVYTIYIDVDLSFTGGADGTSYWMHPTATASDGGAVQWEASKVGHLGQPLNHNQNGGAWTPDPTQAQGVFRLYCGHISMQDLCDVTYNNNIEPISRVVFADIDNSTNAEVDGTSAMEDFTGLVAHVSTDQAYTIALEGNTDGNYTDYFTVFMDWNQDGDFSGTNEMYEIGSITNSTGTDGIQATGSISVPANAPLGFTSMRIIKNYNESPTDPCGNYGWGQTETYSVLVDDGMGIPDYSSEDFTYYPNPVHNVLHINSKKPISHFALYNLLGQRVLKAESIKDGQINLSSLENGLFLFRVTFDGGQVETFRIIKK